MTSPIPINPDATSARQTSPPGLSTTNPGSSASSISPHTPFFPPPGLASSATPTQPSSLFKWAASFGRSPPKPPTIGVDSSQKKAGTEGAEHENVPFEFGDFRDTNAQSWANGRRAMSVSAPYGGPGQSGITELLRNNGSYSPTEPKGVMADKVARGQGVLRRLSMGGYKGIISPPPQNAALPPSPPQAATLPPPAPPAPTPVGSQGVAEINKAAALGGNTRIRGRRYSENAGTRKRGVSPMGERLLREQGHF
ncbi:hypothetical protein J008_03514 [Cryptococcus neoformans]|uniref:Uncharacterized protein n=2 Tax=Cryptococcus neoformans TaxID=5207 RepID=A0A854QIW2_CRYNE|nr:hypothetical protein CNAG_02188 [Cryptococcus neoformans var. grubii H99]AUB25462.1 hypothetical protein CKF44_02188 [Cryptococcus neoformans var. grubii]OWT39005.1 hypothetical protein C362_03168 [Cryptococcus neoformans var. grubii Bt1]OWZ31040.1 hypothetical protein C347_03798 [Cryptococcus neoformans var. grubii AD2-60a]OWZ41352.1 hypothetical protein C353_03643 [Cryptococcus neoformans var. grubii AD1-83a]OWZ43141.1 hypothetical protein C343_03736 [Cryptococcus neoformans var. grubii C|eukprot:XP_012050000.1 hypothetical protein CNAG_02188 [Cryptococcus neoformans var. grubii H99]